jgi:hypothetical protein
LQVFFRSKLGFSLARLVFRCLYRFQFDAFASLNETGGSSTEAKTPYRSEDNSWPSSDETEEYADHQPTPRAHAQTRKRDDPERLSEVLVLIAKVDEAGGECVERFTVSA